MICTKGIVPCHVLFFLSLQCDRSMQEAEEKVFILTVLYFHKSGSKSFESNESKSRQVV